MTEALKEMRVLSFSTSKKQLCRVTYRTCQESLSVFFSFLAFEGKRWLCSDKYFSNDKAALERLCDEGEWSDSGNDGRWHKVTVADGEL